MDFFFLIKHKKTLNSLDILHFVISTTEKDTFVPFEILLLRVQIQQFP